MYTLKLYPNNCNRFINLVQIWKQTKHALASEWVNNSRYIYSMEYYIATEGGQILTDEKKNEGNKLCQAQTKYILSHACVAAENTLFLWFMECVSVA